MGRNRASLIQELKLNYSDESKAKGIANLRKSEESSYTIAITSNSKVASGKHDPIKMYVYI